MKKGLLTYLKSEFSKRLSTCGETLNDAFEAVTDCLAGYIYTSKKAVKKTLTIPVWLNKAAIERNINFSQVLQEALLEKIQEK